MGRVLYKVPGNDNYSRLSLRLRLFHLEIPKNLSCLLGYRTELNLHMHRRGYFPEDGSPRLATSQAGCHTRM